MPFAVLLFFILLAMVVIALIGLIRGRVEWARLRNRKHAAGWLAASFVVLILIGVVAPEQSDEDSVTQPVVNTTVAPRTSPTPSSTSVAPTSTTSAPPSSIPTPPTPTIARTSVLAQTRVPDPMPTPTRVPDLVPFVPAPQTPPAPEPTRAPEVHYANCAAVRSAGAAPIRRGEPGYGTHLDRDRDGIACE
ncbi:excalibur calcium-binding domain-containing protein [Nocardia takedensis]|uniref:excalibur calcium-binding domain-containing protein n=1 Tax=Nocardia takedensis TaxID=259390 RepID=UPI001C3F3C92|nr:excalibur calcium-binding domain-containing protein [Nocardia takedensis]